MQALLKDYLTPWPVVIFVGVPLGLLIFVAVQDYFAAHPLWKRHSRKDPTLRPRG